MKEKNNETTEPVIEAPVQDNSSQTDNLSETEKLIADLKAKVKENLDLAKYQKAEFENYKRRNQNAVNAAFTLPETNESRRVMSGFCMSRLQR